MNVRRLPEITSMLDLHLSHVAMIVISYLPLNERDFNPINDNDFQCYVRHIIGDDNYRALKYVFDHLDGVRLMGSRAVDIAYGLRHSGDSDFNLLIDAITVGRPSNDVADGHIRALLRTMHTDNETSSKNSCSAITGLLPDCTFVKYIRTTPLGYDSCEFKLYGVTFTIISDYSRTSAASKIDITICQTYINLCPRISEKYINRHQDNNDYTGYMNITPNLVSYLWMSYLGEPGRVTVSYIRLVRRINNYERRGFVLHHSAEAFLKILGLSRRPEIATNATIIMGL